MKRLALVTFALLACTSSDAPVGESTTTTTATTTTTSAADANSGTTEGEKNVRVLANGSYGAAASRDAGGGRRAPFVVVANDVQEYTRLWQEHVGDRAMPAVDFGSERVIFLLMGPQSTGGYAIDFHGVRRDGERLEVNATLKHPEEGAITTQAFTAPFAVVAVRDLGFESVEWMNRDRLLARADVVE